MAFIIKQGWTRRPELCKMSLALITVHGDYLSVEFRFHFSQHLEKWTRQWLLYFLIHASHLLLPLRFVSSVWYCIKAFHGSGWTKSNLSQKWTNMEVIYKACSKAFDITQSLNTSQEWDTFIFFFPTIRDWRFNTDHLRRHLHGSGPETIL